MVNKKVKFNGFKFRFFFHELYSLTLDVFKYDTPIVIHFIGDPLDREYFIKDVFCLDNDSKTIMIRVGV